MNNQNMHGRAPGASYDREREMEERHRAMQQHEEMRQEQDREREREREPADRYGSAPHQSTAGAIPIHQPVASRIAGAIHSPGGLLASHGGTARAGPPGGPSAPMGGFSGPPPSDHNRSISHGGPQGSNAQHQVFAHMSVPQTASNNAPSTSSNAGAIFGGVLQQQVQHGYQQQTHTQPQLPTQPSSQQQQHQQQHQQNLQSQQHQQMPQSHESQRSGKPSALPASMPQVGQQIPGGITQGQQPILNDALTYLDQVKVQFHDQPDVYNRFLDIMKDFKSQAIDTPGVINRVSELFAGHPNLIQGFNTFLPPGYRIECGTGNDPNTIRVTTPRGTTVQSIAGRGPQTDSHNVPSAGQTLFPEHSAQWQQQPQQQQQHLQPQHQHLHQPQQLHQGVDSTDGNFSTPVQHGANLFVQAAAQNAALYGAQARNVMQASGAASTGGGTSMRGAQTLLSAGASSGPSVIAGGPSTLERRGPVEFNHAISYVNKIKNRYQDRPEIYKQFLEILQTYQREQKPIQDVYAQVTTLFSSAPDLLEDFKQFLPESAGQAKTTPGRFEDNVPPGLSHTPQPSIWEGQKMPPLGSFPAPASASKDVKKRPRADRQPQNADTSPVEAVLPGRALSGAASANKRPKLNPIRGAANTSTIEPTLTPVMPESYPPLSETSFQDEIAFFERVKKYLANGASMNEFLKLCNLFSQNIIDQNTLYHKGALFLSANPDLFNFWKSFVGVNSGDIMIENRPAAPAGKLSLSNCRGYGPSYRLLPKRERLKTCSGRDDLCNSVLNDQWASHPTWASEDSGFVAHRKNQFEEGLHRVEEERHEYDFNIEINLKCIQLLEPIAQQMLAMSPAERGTFHMPNALAGQSQSIFKRICKKLYGERGLEIHSDLYINPFDVVPVLLTRMKQKDEEWRFSQREWEKVWHAQTEHMYLKSLDHMGILVKSNDKKNLTAKHLVDAIKTKHEEQRRERALKGKAPRHQIAWNFSDKDVILDLLRLMMLYPLHSGQHNAQEKERVLDFFESFVTAFFELKEDVVQERIPKIPPDSAEEEIEEPLLIELTNGRSKRNGRKSGLLRGVLDPSRNTSKPRSKKEDSAASGSKETTPDVGSTNDENVDVAEDSAGSEAVTSERWLPSIPKAVVVGSTDDALVNAEGELKADGFFARPWYNFFANQTIFVFFSIFQTVYSRLLEVKQSHESVAHEIRRLNESKPARKIGFPDILVKYFDSSDDSAKYWSKTLELIEDFIAGDVEEPRFQEILRHYYLKNDWKLYTIQDQLKTLFRLALTCSSTDVKEKTPDLIQQYFANREREETSYQTEISARKFAEKCVKDGDIFVICWFPHKAEATVRWLQRNETTFYVDEMQMKQSWQYYISSFIRVEPTEGVARSRLQKAVLTRNLPASDSDSDTDIMPKPLSYCEKLVTSICLKSSKMVWAPGTAEYFIYGQRPSTLEERERRDKQLKGLSSMRESKLLEKMVHNPPWARNLSQEEVREHNDNFAKWNETGTIPPSTGRKVEPE